MSSFRTIALLFAIVSISSAMKCYSEVVNSGKPSKSDDCNGQYCTKIEMKVGGNSAIAYGCDQTQLCKSNGCFTDYGGSKVCCCSGDRCNSSSKLSSILALFPIVIYKLL
ncbi:hypothetical protein RB195_003058 [Necator americanus]|uniref:ET module n=1 Tax=Necator americanus TaxID=51031 RepID=A0ABR1DLW2_NECAM